MIAIAIIILAYRDQALAVSDSLAQNPSGR
jgi:hypothetical protein